MKLIQSALVVAALLVVGVGSHTNVEAQQTSRVVAPSFAEARDAWKGVGDDLAYLDGLITAKKLSEVHEAAFNLRDSARMLRGASASLSDADKNLLQQSLTKVDALANALDVSGDKNDLRATVTNQRQIHVALDQLAGIFPQGTLPPLGAVAMKGAVKDPVCRMTVDPATSPGKVAYQGQTYYFCSAGDAKAFQKDPARYAALFDDLTFGKPKTFVISLGAPAGVTAGKPALLTFAIRQSGSIAVVKDFQLVHEKLMHLIVVSDDLSYFSHEHPSIGKDGRFRLQWTSPHTGRYFMFADFTPGDGLNQILRTQVTVGGGQPKALPKLVPDKALAKAVDGYNISLKPSAPLVAGKSTLFTYTLTQDGKPITDMEPYLGAMGHLMAINANGRDVVHTHTIGVGGSVSSDMATQSGPSFTYELTPPAPGPTRIWAQFQRNGQVITVPFTFQVGGEHSTTPNRDTNKSEIKLASQKPTPQQVTIALPAGYHEGAATVMAGKPVTLTFHLQKDAGCGNTISVPAAKWTKTLRVGQSASVTFTPQQSGSLKFSCGMDMLHGTLIAK
ncbi:hypothetical protein IAD21_01603 [Abditibacteriota bacterium]|nr:hypothetical protein IAD21_01603 [Abditibacteriota bacterium]